MLWDEDDNDNSERLASTVNKLLGNVGPRKKLLRLLYCVGTLNLIIWAVCLIFPTEIKDALGRVHDLNNKLSMIVLGLPFSLGMTATYSLFRLKYPDIEEQDLDSDMMGSYNYQSHSQRRWLVWLFSTIGGVVNLILLAALVVALGE